MIHNNKCPFCEEPISVDLDNDDDFDIECPKCSNLFHINHIIKITKTPRTNETCYNMSCDQCTIMHETLYGSGLPNCLYWEKSELYLGMISQEASN